MSEKAQRPTGEDGTGTVSIEQGLPISGLKIPMPETNPPKSNSSEKAETASEKRPEG